MSIICSLIPCDAMRVRGCICSTLWAKCEGRLKVNYGSLKEKKERRGEMAVDAFGKSQPSYRTAFSGQRCSP